MFRIPRHLTTLSLGFTVLLAACGGNAAPASSSTQASTSASPSAPASSAASSAAAKPSGSAASASSSATGAPIRVGLIEPLTGPLAPLGKDNQDGFNLYMKSINSTVAGRKIEATFVDDQGKADVGLNKAKQLVESNHVQALMGVVATPVCYAVAPYVKEVKVPFLETAHCGAEDLLTNPKFASPYVTRFSESTSLLADPGADWAYGAGYRKASIICSDFAGGLQVADSFASTFVKRGGQIVQEQYPAQGTTDFGPYIAQLSSQADVLFVLLPGTDGLRFGEQYANYAGQHKLQIIDQQGNMTAGEALAQLKTKAVGMVGTNTYLQTVNTPVNQAFLKAFQAQYPGRSVSTDVEDGYASGQILEAALKKVDGKIEDTQKFLDALYATNVDTPSGLVKLDSNHDVIRNMYVFKIVEQNGKAVPQALHTYDGVSRAWDRTPQELQHFPFGSLKGKWVGMTKDQVAQLSK